MALNMDNLRKTEKWATEERVWLLTDIYSAVAKVAVVLSNGWPRNFYDIMLDFMNKIETWPDVYSSSICKMVSLSLNELTEKIYSTLCSIKCFRELNLTINEYLHGVDVDSDDRTNEWFAKGDVGFIDLEAFKQNIYCELRLKLIEDHFFEQ